MPTLNLGRVKAPPFVPRGAWDSGTAYVINDLVVGISGDSFAAVADSTGEDPESALGSWVFFAAAGPDGPTGPAGPTGATGATGPTGAAGSDATVNATNVSSVITGATEKTTTVDADQMAITDSAASGALKRLTFANLWAWVKAKLDTALTIAGAKTFSGQVELTGQAATYGTSAMTRDLVDSSLIRTKTYHFVLVPAASNWGETHVGTGTLAQQAGGFSLRAGTSAGGVAYIRSDAGVAVRNWQKNVSGKRNTVDWSRRTIIHASIIHFDTSGSDTVARLLFGIPYNQTTVADFTNSQKGIGWKIINSVLWVHYSNGTTAASTSTGQTLTGFAGYDLALDCDGSGNWSVYVNGSLVATGNGAPTGLSADQNHCVAISMTNGTTAGQRYFDLTSLYSRQM